MALKFLLSFMVLYIAPVIVEIHARLSNVLRAGSEYASYCGIIGAGIVISAIWLIWEKL